MVIYLSVSVVQLRVVSVALTHRLPFVLSQLWWVSNMLSRGFAQKKKLFRVAKCSIRQTLRQAETDPVPRSWFAKGLPCD
jgi:hypothetical protein